MAAPDLTVVIPTYNAARTLSACLASVSGRPGVEVIVVDQSSTDDSRGIAEAYGATVVELPPPTFYSPPTASRNAGAAAARGAILYHLDSDMIVPEALLQEIPKRFDDAELVALVVHEQDSAGGFWSKCKAFERSLYWGDPKLEAARVVRASTFRDIGGYDESLASGEDWDIHRRLGAQGAIGWCTEPVGHDLTTLRLWPMLKKKMSYGRSASSFFTKHQESGWSVLAAQGAAFFRHWNAAARHPLLATGAFLLKLAEFGAGGVGAFAARRQRRRASVAGASVCRQQAPGASLGDGLDG